MNTNARPQLLPYLGRFTLLFLATYFVIGLPFLAFQSALPESGRIAIDFYEPFRHFGFMAVAGLTILGSPILLREFITFDGTTSEFFENLIIGLPEIFSQMLIFSLIFFFWQKRAERKQMR